MNEWLQALPSLLKAFALGVLAPAAIALALVWLLGRSWLARAADRGVLALAVAVAVLAGCALLPGVTQLNPNRHYHWLPYIGLLAAVVGSLPPRSGGLDAARWLLLAVAALVAAWRLVPAWDDLWPPRVMSIVMLAGYFLLLTALLDTLPDRLCGVALPGILTLVAAALMAVLIAAAVSARFAQLGGVLMGAFAGCWIGGLVAKPSAGTNLPSADKGLFPLLAMLVGGLAYVGCIDKKPENFAMLLLPAAPLALWACAAGPLSRLKDRRVAIGAQLAVVAVPLLIAATIACLPTSQPNW
jgi:hypothetical protein